jgi:hypothetical protein
MGRHPLSLIAPLYFNLISSSFHSVSLEKVSLSICPFNIEAKISLGFRGFFVTRRLLKGSYSMTFLDERGVPRVTAFTRTPG